MKKISLTLIWQKDKYILIEKKILFSAIIDLITARKYCMNDNVIFSILSIQPSLFSDGFYFQEKIPTFINFILSEKIP